MNKILLYFTIVFSLPMPLHAQSSAYSYVRSRTMTNAHSSEWNDHIDYDNGLGQVYQQVDVAVTPGHQDLVTLQEYDAHRRPSHTWLPGLGSAGYCQDSLALKESARTIHNDSNPFSTFIYEPTPLGRVKRQYYPGCAWYQNQKALYYTEKVDANSDTMYKVMNLTMASSTLLFNGYLNNSKLIKVTTDEDGTIRQECTDMRGNVIAKRELNGTEWLTTYYVYDDSGNLRFVLPPAAAKYFEESLISAQSISPTHEQMLKYAYEYRYDGRGNCIYKRLPGCAPVYYIYDHADRCIFSQTGVQRAVGQWNYTIPDIFGRTVLTGICHNSLTYTAMPLHDVVVTATVTNATNNRYGYTLSNVTLISDTINSVSFYDNYSFIGRNGIPTSLNYTAPPSDQYGNCGITTPRGIPTGTVVARLSSSGVVGYDYTAMYYDDRGRVIQTHSTNHLNGVDVEYIGYDFTDNVLSRRHDHNALGVSHTQVYTFVYDHAGRLLTKKHKLDNNSTVTLVSNIYNDLGQLINTTQNGSLTTNYTYNVRSWLKTITAGNLFTESLYYDESHNGSIPCFSGNISALDWKAPDNVQRGYKFYYDKLSRLTHANYLENTLLNGHYDTEYTYDKMGNMLTLKRYGLQDNSSYGLVDNLSFTYNGNQLIKADDTVSRPYYAGAFHFRDGANATVEYEYDENGNMTKDLNKNISSIQYNSLNLPTSITYSDGRSAAYIYGAGGKKLRVSYKTSPVSTPVPTDYCGSMIYENNVLTQVLVDGGYITFSGTTPQYHFYLKDHLGNNRVVCNASGTAEQVNHYYPFGGLMGESTNGDTQRFKYNGKELDRMHGLDWYDYGARHYDGARGQFTTIDPLAEKDYDISPYAYCADNPINAYDPDGRGINFAIGAFIGAITEYGAQVLGNMAKDGIQLADFKDVDLGDIAIAGAVGAATSGYSSLSTGAKAFRAVITATGEVAKAHYDVEMENGKIAASANSPSKTTNNLVAAGVGKGAGKIMGKTLSKTPTVSSASTNISTRKLAKGIKEAFPKASNKEVQSLAKTIKPRVNSTMRGIKKTTDAIRASSSKAETATSGAVHGILIDDKDKK